MTERLAIKSFINKPEGVRINSLDAFMRTDDNKMQIYVNNGHRPDGSRIQGSIRLDQDQMKQLVEFVQCNIK